MGLKAKVQGLVFPKHEESLSNGVHSSASLFSLNLNVHSPSHWELVVEASVLLLVAAGSGANFCLLSLESDNARSSWFFEEKELSAQLSFPAFIFFLSITPVHLHSFKSPSCNCCWSWLDDGLQCCSVYEVLITVSLLFTCLFIAALVRIHSAGICWPMVFIAGSWWQLL